MPTEKQWAASKARQTIYTALRRFFAAEGYEEVETPLLVPRAGMEPHIEPFEVPYRPQTDVGVDSTLYLHTSPEYAMKRLLADGCGPIFQICKVFRNGEIAAAHNPEFTLLEFYRPQSDYSAIMHDLERALSAVEQSMSVRTPIFSKLPYERLTVRDAFWKFAAIDIFKLKTAEDFAKAALQTGVHVSSFDTWDDVFFHVFLQKVEPFLGAERPTFLTEYPASMAALARLKPDNAEVAERVELYVQGRELANGFSELTDAAVQRERLLEEQAFRVSHGRTALALDEKFLAALPRMPPASGIAVGLDRVLMLLLETERIDDVLLFPAKEYF